MKKVFQIIGVIIVLFIILLYWSLSSTSKEFESSKIIGSETIDSIDFKNQDSVLITASTLYKGDDIKMLMQGEQYRAAWSAPIKVPVVYLDTLFGGMTIIREGGGKQTHSLKLTSANGTIYTLRSINKDPQALIPEFMHVLGLENIVVDGISAQHPYGAIVAAELAKSAAVLHTNPRVVFIPKQTVLGKYNEKFGNRLYLLEYETESDVNWTDLNNIIKIIETKELLETKLTLKDSLHVDKNALIKARLFDMLIGDWDRHAKQWGWALQKRDSGYVALPIAGDRDNAFFNIEGIIPTLISNKNIEPQLRGFKKEIDFLPGLVYPFDQYFLLNTPESVFVNEAEKLQKLISDRAIDEAFKVWQDTLYQLDAKEIKLKIKNRRQDLIIYAKGFKKIIDEKGELNEPLKGTEHLKLNDSMIHCFECQ